MKNKVKGMFKVGDIIRNARPYWGEPAYRLVDEDKYGFLGIWTGSKYGPAQENDGYCRHHISWWDFEAEETMDGPFKKCQWWTRLYLWLIGNTYGRVIASR